MAWAAAGGHIEALAWCVEKGATDFVIAINKAAERGQIEAMAWCAGKDAGMRAINFDQIMAWAASNGQTEAMAWCAGEGATGFDRALHWAAFGGYIEAMAWCAGKGATDFDSAMAWAAREGQIEAIAWCAGKGATDFDEAIDGAAKTGQIEAMRWCAAAGRFARGDRAFTNALASAVNNGSNEMAELCLSWGGDINDPGINETAWVEAVRAGEVAVEPQDPPEAYTPSGGFRFCD